MYFIFFLPSSRNPGQLWYCTNEFPDRFPDRLCISRNLKDRFLEYELDVAVYKGLTVDEEREMVLDVQKGEPLTIGEKLRPAAGP